MISFFQSISSRAKFFIEVSPHIRGHIASFSDSTDTFQDNSTAAEMYGFRNNIKLFCFDLTTSISREDAYKAGVIDFGLYDENILADFNQITTTRQGNQPTSISYQGGSDGNKLDYLDDVLTGRNSEHETVPLAIQYKDLTDVDLISRASTIRFNYYSEMIDGRPDFLEGTFEEGIARVTQYVNDTIKSGGWYTDFMHWHWWVKNYSKSYFKTLGDLLSGKNVYSGSFSEIGEYYFVKEAVDTITYNQDTGVVSIDYSKKYPNSPYQNINTPLWVNINLSGTPLNNKDITTSHGGKIRKIKNNEYSIAIDLDFNNTSISFTISETQTPDYINLNKPVVTRNGNDISSDQPIKITLFSNLKSNTYELSSVIEERQLTLETNFTLATNLDTANKNYFLGFINEEGVSGTLEF